MLLRYDKMTEQLYWMVLQFNIFQYVEFINCIRQRYCLSPVIINGLSYLTASFNGIDKYSQSEILHLIIKDT